MNKKLHTTPNLHSQEHTGIPVRVSSVHFSKEFQANLLSMPKVLSESQLYCAAEVLDDFELLPEKDELRAKLLISARDFVVKNPSVLSTWKWAGGAVYDIIQEVKEEIAESAYRASSRYVSGLLRMAA